MRTLFKILCAVFFFTASVAAAVWAGPIPSGKTSEFMRGEHQQLHATLERLAQTPGKTGAAAKQLLTIVRPHLFREEKFVMPELGILRSLALGEAPGDLTWVIPLSEELRKQYPQMLADHREIAKYADKLSRAAELEGDQTALSFVAHLKTHLQDEEDIVYPAAILAGQNIKNNLQSSKT